MIERQATRTGRDFMQLLWCPFKSHMNPYVELAHEASAAWGRTTGLLPDASALHQFEQARFARLTARAYPTAPLAQLVLVAEWNLWLFVHDDDCDASDAGHDPDALARLHGQLGPVVRGDAPPSHAPVSARALAELIPRIYRCARPGWRERFIAVVDAYFAGCVWEASNRARAVVPSIDEYLAKRRDTGAVRTSIAMIEVCERLDLDEAVLAHPEVQAMCDACNDVVCWANDIASAAKERAEHDTHNLVLLLEHHRCPRDFAGACTLAGRMHNARVSEFMRLSEALPSFGGVVDRQLGRFVGTLQAWMRGNLEWACESGRYADA